MASTKKPKTRIRIGIPKTAKTPSWFIIDLGYGEAELQLGKDMVEAMKARGYVADGQVINEVAEDF